MSLEIATLRPTAIRRESAFAHVANDLPLGASRRYMKGQGMNKCGLHSRSVGTPAPERPERAQERGLKMEGPQEGRQAGLQPDELSDAGADLVRSLIHLDVDAMHAYGEALDRIESSQVEIRSRLVAFQEDHDRHIREFSELLQRAGLEVPERRRDFRGLVLETMTALRASLGPAQALKAVRQTERLANRRASEAVTAVRAPLRMVELLRRMQDDERRHLDYIERALAGRIWSAHEPRIATSSGGRPR